MIVFCNLQHRSLFADGRNQVVDESSRALAAVCVNVLGVGLGARGDQAITQCLGERVELSICF